MKLIIYTVRIMLIFIVIAVMSSCYTSSPSTAGNRHYIPDWAPAYERGVRYYYIPDIETYYDVSRGNFVYLDRGMWIFSSDLPPMYSGYDLYSGYYVVVDRRTYEPWRYHQNYSSQYPRYYYRELYGSQGNSGIRGYNENVGKPVYSSPSGNDRRNSSSTAPQVGSGTNRETRSSDYGNRRQTRTERENSDMRPAGEQSPSGVTTRRQKPSTGSGIGSGNESSGEVKQERRTTTAPPSERRRQEAETNSNSGEERKSNRRR